MCNIHSVFRNALEQKKITPRHQQLSAHYKWYQHQLTVTLHFCKSSTLICIHFITDDSFPLKNGPIRKASFVLHIQEGARAQKEAAFGNVRTHSSIYLSILSTGIFHWLSALCFQNRPSFLSLFASSEPRSYLNIDWIYLYDLVKTRCKCEQCGLKFEHKFITSVLLENLRVTTGLIMQTNNIEQINGSIRFIAATAHVQGDEQLICQPTNRAMQYKGRRGAYFDSTKVSLWETVPEYLCI